MKSLSFLRLGCPITAALLLWTTYSQGQQQGMHDIDPTADVHPSVILEGKVTVGAYTKIDAGTVICCGVERLLRLQYPLR